MATAQTICAPVPSVRGALPAARPERVVSLDVFRGITIAGMILVNDPGSWEHIYSPLEHADWNGCTPADLIFPFFLFIVGVSMTLSFASRLERGASRVSMAWHLLRRSALLFAIGLFLNGLEKFNLHEVRIMGVLQRIALCYLAAGMLYLWARGNRTEEPSARQSRTQVLVIACVAALLLAGYWGLMAFVPTPGYGAGHLGKTDNLAAYIDRTLFGSHLWTESQTWDPEGLLSTLPAIATVLIGILCGAWMRNSQAQGRTAWRRVAGLMFSGGALIAAGWLLNPYFPINKNLWTSTFVLFTAGWALLFLALCYGVVDVLGRRGWTGPFLVLGRNAILAFSVSALLAILGSGIEFTNRRGETHNLQEWIYRTGFHRLGDGKNASLAFAICFVLLIFGLLWPLDRRKVFIRI